MRKKVTRYKTHYRHFRKQRVVKVREAAKHPFAVPVATFFGLAMITAGLVWFMQRTPAAPNPNVVVISYDKQRQIVSSKEPTVRALLNKLALTH